MTVAGHLERHQRIPAYVKTRTAPRPEPSSHRNSTTTSSASHSTSAVFIARADRRLYSRCNPKKNSATGGYGVGSPGWFTRSVSRSWRMATRRIVGGDRVRIVAEVLEATVPHVAIQVGRQQRRRQQQRHAPEGRRVQGRTRAPIGTRGVRGEATRRLPGRIPRPRPRTQKTRAETHGDPRARRRSSRRR